MLRRPTRSKRHDTLLPSTTRVRSAGVQPVGRDADYDEVVFAEDHAEFTRRDGTLTTIMDVLVSGEDDGEVRRVSLTNSGRRSEEHTSELQSLMRSSYAVFCLNKKKHTQVNTT